MNYRHLFSVAVCATVLLLSQGASAQSWPPLDRPASVDDSGKNDVALLIGVEDYTYLPDVEGAASNLADWERFLRQDLGLSKVMVLRDQHATREEILRMADRAAAEATEKGRLWVVFIGHGAPQLQTGEPILVGVDGQATPHSVSERGVLHSELLQRIEKGKQSHTVALLDACFSGRDADGDEILEGVQPVVPAAVAATTARTTLLTAAAPDQVAGRLPGTRRPAFSYLVLGGLRGWADDGDGKVTAAEAVEFSRVELLGVPGRDQTPTVVGDGDIVLTAGASEKRPEVMFTGKTASPAAEASAPAESTAVARANVEDQTVVGDGEFDFPLMARIGIGAAGSINGPTTDLGANLGVGWKFDGPDSFEWRAVLNVHFADYRQFGVGDSVTLEYEEVTAQGTIDEGNPMLDWRTSLLAASIGPGFAWRNESGTNSSFDHVVSAEVFGLVGYVIKYCDPSENIRVSQSGSLSCSTTDPLTPGVGARLGYTWKFLDVGFSASYAFAAETVVFNTTFGFALDP